MRTESVKKGIFLPLIAAILSLLLVVTVVPAKRGIKNRLAVMNFPAAPVMDVGEAPQSVAAADFNGDGHQDLIVANARSNNLTVLLGNSKGKLRAARAIEEFSGGLLAGDFNNDGRADLLLIDAADYQFRVLLNGGEMEFRAQAPAALGGALVSAISRTSSLGDFNNDGRLDASALVVSPSGRWQTVILLGDGRGGFADRVAVDLEGVPVTQTTLDANNDGITDIAIANITGITILLGQREAADIGAQLLLESIKARLIASADFDRDGRADLVAASSEGRYWLVRGDGSGGFDLAQEGSVRGNFSVAVAGDYDGDGFSDLALVRSMGDASLLRGDSEGRLTAAGYFTLSGTNMLAAVAADINADKRADLIAVSTDNDSISILFGHEGGFFSRRHYLMEKTIAYTASGDFNNDGRLDLLLAEQDEAGGMWIMAGDGRGEFTATAQLPTLPFPSGVASADLDGDGQSDFVFSSSNTDQIGMLLSSYGLNEENMFVFATGNERGGPRDLVIGDFDGDGLRDIAVANANALGGSKNITLFAGLNNGSFARIENIALGAVPRHLMAGDFNGDGITDLVTEADDPQQLMLLLGARTQMLEIRTLPVAVEALWGCAAADFNKDGVTDLVIADTLTQQLIALTLDGSGQLQRTERVATLQASMLLAADINNDGNADLLALGHRATRFLLGRGDGSFVEGPQIHISPALRLIVNDFNRDGSNDLIVVGRDYFEPVISQ